MGAVTGPSATQSDETRLHGMQKVEVGDSAARDLDRLTQALQDGTLSRLPQRGCKGRPGLSAETKYRAVLVDRVPDENDAVTAGGLYAVPSIGA